MVNSNDFQYVFQHCDIDGDGKVSAAELQQCIKLVSGEIPEEAIEEIVRSLDSDGDGLLGFEDFVELVNGKHVDEEEKIKDLREAFGMYATTGEGEVITPQSLKRMLSLLGELKTIDECEMMIAQFDLNGDGMLSFHEFMVMML